MTTKQVCVSLIPDLLDKVEGYAAARDLTRSAAVSELIARGLAALDREAEQSALAARLDEVAAVAYANHAILEWYLPQAFQPSEARRRPRVTRKLDLASGSDYFLALGEVMAGNGGNLGSALAETVRAEDDFELDVTANDFVDRADFAAFYSKAGIGIESARAQRDARKRREQGPGTPVANGSQPA